MSRRTQTITLASLVPALIVTAAAMAVLWPDDGAVAPPAEDTATEQVDGVLTGIAGEDAFFLAIAFDHVDLRGLLLAGILIGALGVLDDVAITQAATVTEIAGADPSPGFGGLY